MHIFVFLTLYKKNRYKVERYKITPTSLVLTLISEKDIFPFWTCLPFSYKNFITPDNMLHICPFTNIYNTSSILSLKFIFLIFYCFRRPARYASYIWKNSKPLYILKKGKITQWCVDTVKVIVLLIYNFLKQCQNTHPIDVKMLYLHICVFSKYVQVCSLFSLWADWKIPRPLIFHKMKVSMAEISQYTKCSRDTTWFSIPAAQLVTLWGTGSNQAEIVGQSTC